MFTGLSSSIKLSNVPLVFVHSLLSAAELLDAVQHVDRDELRTAVRTVIPVLCSALQPPIECLDLMSIPDAGFVVFTSNDLPLLILRVGNIDDDDEQQSPKDFRQAVAVINVELYAHHLQQLNQRDHDKKICRTGALCVFGGVLVTALFLLARSSKSSTTSS